LSSLLIRLKVRDWSCSRSYGSRNTRTSF